VILFDAGVRKLVKVKVKSMLVENLVFVM